MLICEKADPRHRASGASAIVSRACLRGVSRRRCPSSMMRVDLFLVVEVVGSASRAPLTNPLASVCAAPLRQELRDEGMFLTRLDRQWCQGERDCQGIVIPE